jgi:acyl dehydratase
MTTSPTTLKVGDAIGPLEKAPITTRQLVMYAGASGDFNPIHYDEPFARAAGFPSVIAHGMLSMAFFGELLSSTFGPHRVRRLSARFRAVTFPGEIITVSGTVTAVDAADGTASLALTAKKTDGTVTLDGAALVALSV